MLPICTNLFLACSRSHNPWLLDRGIGVRALLNVGLLKLLPFPLGFWKLTAEEGNMVYEFGVLTCFSRIVYFLSAQPNMAC